MTSFFMFGNIHLNVTSQHFNVMMSISIQCDSLCTNCQFLKTGRVSHITVPQKTNVRSLCLVVEIPNTHSLEYHLANADLSVVELHCMEE